MGKDVILDRRYREALHWSKGAKMEVCMENLVHHCAFIFTIGLVYKSTNIYNFQFKRDLINMPVIYTSENIRKRSIVKFLLSAIDVKLQLLFFTFLMEISLTSVKFVDESCALFLEVKLASMRAFRNKRAAVLLGDYNCSVVLCDHPQAVHPLFHGNQVS